MERKQFIRKIAAGGSILLVAPFVFNSCSDGTDDIMNDNGDSGNNSGNSNAVTVDLNGSDMSALKTVGGYAYKGNIIIIRASENQYIALSKVCTHQGCTVEYSKSSDQVVCPCHSSVFTTSGSVVSGPASANLKKYTVKVEGNSLTIS